MSDDPDRFELMAPGRMEPAAFFVEHLVCSCGSETYREADQDGWVRAAAHSCEEGTWRTVTDGGKVEL